ncbi:hypothetical protein PISL3812_09312 [Talaromyces islandicus]|uniref:Chromosome transmission fidelity protein 8 n=1 Tax=Talaromyces islandicus TaxID=28573 RepID=A0A0U1M9K6_TALIS|nr:hypothetical protein PISL3812_09312 [Talaromyces islandicus]
MPSVPLFPPHKTGSSSSSQNAFSPLPPLLQTPSGLAILELQGTINIPSSAATDKDGTVDDESNYPDKDTLDGKTTIETELGRLMFPDYIDGMDVDNNTKWMKRAYLFVGRYQRMTGEVKKLAKPLAVIQRRQRASPSPAEIGKGEGGDELEIVEIIKYKIVFASRPEPVGIE